MTLPLSSLNQDHNLKALQSTEIDPSNLCVLFDTDLKIVAVFNNCNFHTCVLSTQTSLWLMRVASQEKEGCFFELKYFDSRAPFTYKKSSAHPDMINQKSFQAKAEACFQQLLTRLQTK